MSEFAQLLRTYRKRSVDPEHGRILTQERLGELIGHYLGDMGVVGATISYWESGKSSISQNDRDVLLALVYALHQARGIHSLDDANALLSAGNYRALNEAEARDINPEWAPLGATAVSPPPFSGNWERLRHYLADELYQAMVQVPRHEMAAHCLPHLRQLLAAVVTYLPRHLALELLRQPRPPEQQIGGHFLEGTLLFADISGFTPLTARLRQMAGHEGAEAITNLVNECLDVLLGVLFKHNGRLIRFSGDAMLCLFANPDAQGAMDALWAAWEMQAVMSARFAQVQLFQELFPLHIKLANHTGLLFAATAGTAEHMEYILTGSVVEQTAQAETAADRDDIIISAETYRLVQERITAEPLLDHPDFFRVTAVPHRATASLSRSWDEITELLDGLADDLWGIAARLDALTPYLPARVLPQLIYQRLQEEMEGQHRPATVLFANFTGMSQVINAHGPDDPEGIARVLNEYLQAMQEEVAYYGGVINKVDLYDQGDKLMVIFGAPVAHERDARRAALTALAMQAAMNRLQASAAALLSQRIGLHTGFVFAGSVGSARHHQREYTIMGDTVNLAARLMAQVAPGEVWVSQAVWQQIEAEFTAVPLPPVALSGIDQPTPVYRLEQAQLTGPVRQRHPPLFSPLVGREGELDFLRKRYDDLVFGAGKQIVAITGEGGVGKSRLLTEWRTAVTAVTAPDDPVTWLVGYGRAYGQRPHTLFQDILAQSLDFAADDSSDMRWQKLSKRLHQGFAQAATGWLDRANRQLAYLGYFLNLDFARKPDLARYLDDLEPEARQMNARLAVADWLTVVAGERPCIIILEDLHWADTASLDMLLFLVAHLPDDLPLLFCLVFRPQRQHPVWQTWQELERHYRAYCHPLPLAELRDGAGRQLLSNLLQTEQLPATLQTFVLTATDGNPLYMEELLYALIAGGDLTPTASGWQTTGPLRPRAAPPSLYQVIQSRIDDLDFSSPGARRVLWLAAILGLEFATDSVRHLFQMTGRDLKEFDQHMRAIRNADIFQPARVAVGTGERPGFRFRHGLVQQVAYDNMPVSKRRQYHAQVAEWLEETYAADLSPHVDVLAYHFDRGQQKVKAFTYHRQAGTRDAQAYANESALGHLQRALELAGETEVDGNALADLLLELGQVMATTGDFAGAQAHWQQAYELPGQGERFARRQARLCYEMGRLGELQKDLEDAWAWRERGLALLPGLPTPEAAMLHALGGIVQLRQGQYTEAEQEARQAWAEAEASGALSAGGVAHRLLSIALRAQGRLAEALAHCHQSIAICEETGDLLGQVKNYSNLGVLTFEMDDWAATGEAYRQAITLLARVGDRYEQARVLANLADLSFHQGDLAQSAAQARQALALAEPMAAAQVEIIAHVILAMVAWRQEAWAAMGVELATAAELAATAVDFQPTVDRWRAQLALAQGDAARAQAIFEPWLAADAEVLADEAEPVQRLYAQALAAGGETERAVHLLTESLQRLREAEMRYQTGQALLALAEIVAGVNGREAEARAYAIEAQMIFVQLGASLDTAVAEKLLAKLPMED
ncbi:MAG: AAA family ATPase [Anaerolinea sp.]|nr:AAA family ATPase [Anaerolinea sp.]